MNFFTRSFLLHPDFSLEEVPRSGFSRSRTLRFYGSHKLCHVISQKAQWVLEPRRQLFRGGLYVLVGCCGGVLRAASGSLTDMAFLCFLVMAVFRFIFIYVSALPVCMVSTLYARPVSTEARRGPCIP